MRRQSQLALSVILGTALFASPLAWADGGGQCSGHSGERHTMSRHGGHAHGGVSAHMLGHLLKNKQELGLTDEQIAKMRTLALDADRAHIRAQADVMVSKRELRALLWDEKAEMPAIEAKIKEKESFDATARIISIRAKRELIGVLTPEQKTKMKALWEQRRQQDRSHQMRAEDGESITEANGVELSMESSETEVSELEGSSAG